MSECKEENKILNPLTKRCILIDGKVGQKVIKEYYKYLRKEDIAKLNKLKKPRSPNTAEKQKDMEKKPTHVEVNDDQISGTIKRRIEKYLAAYKEKHDLYVDNKHREACNKNNTNGLSVYEDEVVIRYTVKRLRRDEFNVMTMLTDKPTFYSRVFHDRIPFNNYIKKVALSLVEDGQVAYTQTWLNEVDNYIMSLPKEDLMTLSGYTKHGDELINNLKRGKFDIDNFYDRLDDRVNYWKYSYMPVFFQAKALLLGKSFSFSKHVGANDTISLNICRESKALSSLLDDKNIHTVESVIRELRNRADFDWDSEMDIFYCIMERIATCFTWEFWEEVILQFGKDLDRIIRAAPSLKQKITVYRGVRDDYYLKGAKNGYYKNNGFVSTSLKATDALDFINPDTSCCLKRVVLLPGTRCIFLSGLSSYENEMEVLLPSDAMYFVRNAKVKTRYLPDSYGKVDEVCPEKTPFVYVTDVVVVK